MNKVGHKHFVSLEDYEDRPFEVNPKDTISKVLKKFLSEIPADHISLYVIEGKNLFYSKQYVDAINTLSKALDINSKSILGWYYRGLSFIKLEEYLKAEHDFSQIIDLEPDFIEAYNYRANVRTSLKTYESIQGAISDYSMLILNNVNSDKSYFLRGYCYLLLKQEDKAFMDWKKAKEYGTTTETEDNWKRDYPV